MNILKKYIKIVNRNKNIIDIPKEEEENYIKDHNSRLASDESLSSLMGEVANLYIKYREGNITEKWELKDFIHKALLLHKMLYGKDNVDKDEILSEIA